MRHAASWGIPLVLATLTVAAVSFAYPAAAAIVCPACYGFDRSEGAIFLDHDASPDDRARIAGNVERARAKVEAFYGRTKEPPRILACAAEACYRRLGGSGSRGMAILDAGLILSPRADVVIAAHELAHAALHARIGKLATWQRTIPQWFDEGLAVVVSDDPRYLAPPGQTDRCLVEPDGPLPTDRASWIERAESRALYAKAACRVSRWVARMGGTTSALAAIDHWAAGAPFDPALP